MRIFDRFKYLDPWIYVVVVIVASIGFLMLYSAAQGSLQPWALKQMLRFGVGLVIMTWVGLTDSRFWMSSAYVIYGVSLLLLIGVELMGYVGMGAQRWIDLYIFNLQPSELMKIALVLALARYFHSSTMEEVRQNKYLLTPILLMVVPALLVMRQPDLGTAMMLLFAGVVIIFLSGVQLWKFLVSGGILCASLPILWYQLHEYQQKRILVFLNPELDPRHAGYHVTQSKIALGSGGFWGKGFMEGTQSHLSFLPEKQTDFIFTMFCEEFGMVGALFLLGLYATLMIRFYLIAFAARHTFTRLMSTGIGSLFFFYVFVNTGMVMGILPVVGVPLPLMSYGGTSMLTVLFSIGLILSARTTIDNRFSR